MSLIGSISTVRRNANGYFWITCSRRLCISEARKISAPQSDLATRIFQPAQAPSLLRLQLVPLRSLGRPQVAVGVGDKGSSGWLLFFERKT